MDLIILGIIIITVAVLLILFITLFINVSKLNNRLKVVENTPSTGKTDIPTHFDKLSVNELIVGNANIQNISANEAHVKDKFRIGNKFIFTNDTFDNDNMRYYTTEFGKGPYLYFSGIGGVGFANNGIKWRIRPDGTAYNLNLTNDL